MRFKMILKRYWKLIIMIGGPLFLGTLEIWHPHHVDFNEMVSSHEKANWWLILHLLQLPLFGLLALSVFFLLENIKNVASIISKIGLWFFIVFYTALDSVAGISTGILFHFMNSNPDLDQNEVLNDLFITLFQIQVPGGGLIVKIAVLSWLIAGISATIALYLKGYNRIGVILIGIATIVFQSHAYPNGTIAMYLLTVGIILIQFFPWHFTEVKHSASLK
ncbi:hypothetical protein [Chengkuizengella axinellae]|uniref:DUF4386 family protein n=1 Tax=Chengkuizengella axinellae TaxID=3064388 RepID=A0ABT9J3K0_9BACL|nr:hypothetical protein [Chengkuizengella sp. 2205SS18-9]MDP5275564.1 hypothetical protein [Chengkuizengella sp. 2205SS18-9]